jgi:hypothetical protein
MKICAILVEINKIHAQGDPCHIPNHHASYTDANQISNYQPVLGDSVQNVSDIIEIQQVFYFIFEFSLKFSIHSRGLNGFFSFSRVNKILLTTSIHSFFSFSQFNRHMTPPLSYTIFSIIPLSWHSTQQHNRKRRQR